MDDLVSRDSSPMCTCNSCCNTDLPRSNAIDDRLLEATNGPRTRRWGRRRAVRRWAHGRLKDVVAKLVDRDRRRARGKRKFFDDRLKLSEATAHPKSPANASPLSFCTHPRKWSSRDWVQAGGSKAWLDKCRHKVANERTRPNSSRASPQLI